MADTTSLDTHIAAIIERLQARNAAREAALAASRRIIRLSANSIRAVHRADFNEASILLAEARQAHQAIAGQLETFPDLYYAGFVQDAEKELAEAATTQALLSGEPLPGPRDLGVADAPWLNGIAEAIGELRRWILDHLRQGQFEGTDAALQAMDEIYSVLVTIDFPDAMTGGLRRTTDLARGILERTRGDLTMAVVQQDIIRVLGEDRSVD